MTSTSKSKQRKSVKAPGDKLEYTGTVSRMFKTFGYVEPGGSLAVDEKDVDRLMKTGLFKKATANGGE